MSLFDSKEFGTPPEKKGEKKLIQDLGVGDRTDSYYKILSVDKRTKKDGNPYLSLMLMDKTGKIAAKVWNDAEIHYKTIQPGEVYRVSGSVNEFMNRKEIKVTGISVITSSDPGFDKADFVEEAEFDTDPLFDQMMGTMREHIVSPHLLKLLDFFVEDYGEKFKVHYGAQKIHHAYLGGLMDHTYSMMKVAIFCADHYELDKELLLIGVLFHDFGKVYEFSVEPVVDMTFEGGLLGHLVIGVTKFNELTARISGFPEDLSVKIRHLIVSHHGEKEYGSPEVPKIPEAFVLHIIDLLDSKLKIVEEAVKGSETKGLYSDYIHTLGRRLYVPPKD
ncbi:MAG: HD domain-containing protein [bacterium]|nr:HD domain-containing protein [bacterium]